MPMSGPNSTTGAQAIKEKFQASGNMGRMIGAQTVAPEGAASDVAVQNAGNAQQAVQEQDEQLRGTSPRESLPAEQQEVQQPSGEAPQQQQEEELIPKSVFLKRTANDVRRRQEAEEKLATIKAENEELRRGLPQQRQEPRQEYQAEQSEYVEDENSLITQELRFLRDQIERQGQAIAQSHRDQVRREMLTALGGNKDLAVHVNEVFKDGTAGLDLAEALRVAAMRNPEINFFDGPEDDGRDGPAYHAQSGRSAQSGNRTPPKTEQDQEGDLLAQLRGTGNQSDKTVVGKELLRRRMGKHKIFSGGDPRRR